MSSATALLGQLVPAWLTDLLAGSDRTKTLLATALPAGVVGAYLLHRWSRGRDLPPGPVGLPVLGRLPWVDPSNLHIYMLQVAQKYGDICSFYLGGRLFIVVNSYPLLKEMLDDLTFAGRPRLRVIQKLTKDCGIIFTEGETWNQHRRLSLRTLRDFGFARARTVEMIDEQLEVMFQAFDSAESKPIQVLSTFLLASNSIITEMTLGHRFEINDPKFQEVNGHIQALLESGIAQSASVLFPAIERLVELFPSSSSDVRHVNQLHEFIRGEISLREKVMSGEASEPECLCDFYIQEKRKAEEAGDRVTFQEFQLIRVCFEFYLAGTDTTARSMEWLMLYMAAHPEVQDRMHKELDEVIGQSRRPKMQDKAALHYTSAVIDETFRKVSLATIGVFHRAVRDTSFHGYRIPSDAIIIPLVYGIHHRADYWQRPGEFFPEHFLDKDGHYQSRDELIPFLIGRRACIGESLARMEIFLFFTALMQRYRVRLTPESQARKAEVLAGHLGNLLFPGNYRILISRRQQA